MDLCCRQALTLCVLAKITCMLDGACAHTETNTCLSKQAHKQTSSVFEQDVRSILCANYSLFFIHSQSDSLCLPKPVFLLKDLPLWEDNNQGRATSLLPLCILKRLPQLASLLMMSVYFRVSCSPNISPTVASPAGRLTRSLALRHCFKRGPLCTCIEFKWETQPWSAGLKKQHLLFLTKAWTEGSGSR